MQLSTVNHDAFEILSRYPQHGVLVAVVVEKTPTQKDYVRQRCTRGTSRSVSVYVSLFENMPLEFSFASVRGRIPRLFADKSRTLKFFMLPTSPVHNRIALLSIHANHQGLKGQPSR